MRPFAVCMPVPVSVPVPVPVPVPMPVPVPVPPVLAAPSPTNARQLSPLGFPLSAAAAPYLRGNVGRPRHEPVGIHLFSAELVSIIQQLFALGSYAVAAAAGGAGRRGRDEPTSTSTVSLAAPEYSSPAASQMRVCKNRTR